MGPKGEPALVKGDPQAGPADQRVPITAKGVPTAIYAAPVREANDGMRVRAIATVTLTKCAITDYIPNQRAHTACQGTRRYGYDPVRIETAFRLVGGDEHPDLTGPSQALGQTVTTTCTTAIHHCSISQDYEEVLDDAEIAAVRKEGKFNWVVFEATASAPQAAGCAPPKPARCNVLAVETQKGTAMYWIQADGDIAEPDHLVAALAHDDGGEFLRPVELAARSYRELALIALDAATRDLGVLGADRLLDVVGRQTPRRHTLRIEPHAHRVAAFATDEDVADAGEPLQALLEDPIGDLGELAGHAIHGGGPLVHALVDEAGRQPQQIRHEALLPALVPPPAAAEKRAEAGPARSAPAG